MMPGRRKSLLYEFLKHFLQNFQATKFLGLESRAVLAWVTKIIV